MMANVYESANYREFLINWLGSQPHKGRGLRTRMAEVIGTQTGYVTQVFQEMAEFSLEQGIKISQWIGLDQDSQTYFLLLLQRDRSGTPELKSHFNQQISQALEKRKDLSRRLEVKPAPSKLDQASYFSSWINAAVHVALTCQNLKTAEDIAKLLNTSLPVTRKTLEFLKNMGLAKEENGLWSTGEARMHLGTNSPNLINHHLNWNLRAIQAIEIDLLSGLHYSSVVSLSTSDLEKIREILTQAIDSSKKITRDSEGEKVYGLTLNLFSAGNN